MKMFSPLQAALVAGLIALPATAQAVDVSYLTHWGPDTVKLLEDAAASYTSTHPDTNISIRAVPFGDLLTTLRSSGGGSGAATIGGIYDVWLPELVRDGLVVPAPDAVAGEVQSSWPAGVVSAATVDGTLYGIPNEIDVYALNYNKALFEAAGVPPSGMTTSTRERRPGRRVSGSKILRLPTGGISHCLSFRPAFR